ncbi:MAG: adenylate/guanylate cyclase domain-containing protein, partial [Anaerolineae bacterium]
VRRLPLTIESRGERYPAFALAVLSEFLRLPPQDYIPQRGYVDFGGRRIPVDQFNRTFINYVGPPNSIPIYSYVDVLNGQVDTSVFNDKMVLVGIMATAEPDSYVTPTSVEKMFGVELHANVIETVLQSRFLQTQNLSGQMAVVILMSLLAGIVFPQVRPVRSTFFVLLFLAAYLLISFFSFDAGLILNLVYPFLALTLTYIAILLYRYFYEERRRRAITKLFGRYVSPEVVGAVLDSFDKGTLQLGGTNRVATVLFADIRGFTSMSEKLPPEELMNTLNDYLSIMVEIIFKYEGTVNKFIGDNVMAMWNAPLDQPDHALRAVKAAVDMQREIEALQRQNNKIPKVGFGIGINTGPMVAGNVGSQERLEYTVIGDTVNLASRLCGAAASGQVLISPETHQLVKDEIVGHRLTPMKFKGKEKPIAVYEVLRYQIR